MRTARLPQPEPIPGLGSAVASRRAQPARQARTNPPRSSLSGSGAGRDAHRHDQPIEIFPGLVHFTDSIASLPKDLVRHFTLLKEVDAKIFAPEEALFKQVDSALKSNPPEPQPANDGTSSIAPASAPMSAQNSSTGHPMNGSLPSAPSTGHNYNAIVYAPANLPRRQLFRDTALKLQDMLHSLEEKNHVISTANEALSKHLARIDNVWPHLENEFSEEAKWGSSTHWAYPENRVSKSAAAERSRRDGASALSAAAQQIAEEAAARTEARKQAVAAKKGLKNQHQDSDHDPDHETSRHQKNEPTKKSSNSRSRKTTDAPAPVGLGISAGSTVNGHPPPKKRKVENDKEKPVANGGQPMERALSGVFGSSASKAKGSSPRSTPVPDGASKKRKALPTVNGQSKKSKNGLPSALSPSVASSPILPNLDSKTVSHASSAPPVIPARPPTSRARNNSTASNLESSKQQRPQSSASNRPNGTLVPVPDVLSASNGPRPPTDFKPPKEILIPVKTEVPTPDDDATTQPTVIAAVAVSRSRKNSMVKEDAEPKGEIAQGLPQTVTTVVTTKSGRASKPSTPALGSFPDPIRSRSSRTAQAGGAKRSHKKGASISAQAAIVAQALDEDNNGSVHGDEDGDIDANEPRYCYCNNVSYGEMVACDADDCEKEWFHLGCVGLRSAPSSSSKFSTFFCPSFATVADGMAAKWYCDNCKNRMKNGKKATAR
ncbi:hypothetical protein BX600DRAFT_131512 [Xylariales sp. PMI_506]|nr:hypothetical protein BX600DRAFT_131512 [Xylariales sp. PMI_506]